MLNKKNPLCIALICFLCITIAHAQDKNSTLTQPPAKIKIDGSIAGWGDSLHYYSAEKHLNYSIANTKDTLYMAIRFNDRADQVRVLHAGLTFTVDPKGKKKEAFSITFPLTTGTGLPVHELADTGFAESTQQEREQLMRDRLTSLRGIKVTGFKDIDEEMITTANTYGIQTAVDYDDNGYLVCEAAIPLQYFHADDPYKNEWSFNFKVNGIAHKSADNGNNDSGEEGGGRRGGMGGGMGGMGGGHRGGRGGGMGGGEHNGASTHNSGQSELNKSEDFWVKYYLAH